MKIFLRILLPLSFLLLANSCGRSLTALASIDTVNNNVCKRLTGKIVLYAVFVDTKTTHPWSRYDIYSTLDSIKKGMKWLEDMASENGISLEIDVKWFQNKDVIPLAKDLPGKTLLNTLFSPTLPVGISRLDRWADGIAKDAGQCLPKDTIKVTKTKNNMSDRERLIAMVRNANGTDNVALMYFLNNYFNDESSVTLHTASKTQIEYSIVSYKYPSIIVHEFLHLFGALDLYITPFDVKGSSRKNKSEAMDMFPNEIMAFAYRQLSTLEISPITRYLIGWSNQLDDKYTSVLLGKKLRVLKY